MAAKQRRGTVRKYYQGWVYVKRNEDKLGYQRLFAELRAGKDLRFYADETRAMGTGDKYDFRVLLRGLKGIDEKNDRRPSNQHPEYLFILKFNDSRNEIKMRMASSDDRDVWVRYLSAAGLSKFPERTAHLLPGQIHEINDIIDAEKEDYVSMQPLAVTASPEPWFYPMVKDRYDAEVILKSSVGHGNMLVRGRRQENQSDEYAYAVSIMTSISPEQFKHYRVKKSETTGEYFIYLNENPHPMLESRKSVMSYFENRSNNRYERCRVAFPVSAHLYEPHIPAGDRPDVCPVYENDLNSNPRVYSNVPPVSSATRRPGFSYTR